MKQTTIGRSGIDTPALILGGNVFGWALDEASSFAILDAAAELGFNAIDTADVYSFWVPGNRGGESEEIIGRWLKRGHQRDEIMIHTKGGAPGAPGEFANAKLNSAYLTKAVEGSLRRLGTDVIDLYYVHYDDITTPVEETLRTFERLIDSGKIRAIGASNYSAERLSLALKASDKYVLPRYICLQTHYNLYDRASYETEIESLCVKAGLGVMTYFSLASGFLTGKYRSEVDLAKSVARGSDVKTYLNPRGFRILAALDKVGAQYDATPAQVALAWLMARPGITAPVASATSLAQLHDLFAATMLVLNADSITELDTASSDLERVA